MTKKESVFFDVEDFVFLSARKHGLSVCESIGMINDVIIGRVLAEKADNDLLYDLCYEDYGEAKAELIRAILNNDDKGTNDAIFKLKNVVLSSGRFYAESKIEEHFKDKSWVY